MFMGECFSNKMLFSYREKMSFLKTITKFRLGEKRLSLSRKVHKNMYKTLKHTGNG